MSAADDQLGARVRALAEAVEAIDGRGTPDVVAKAKAVVGRAGERVAFSGSYTVVAFAGATGSGKSSLFNAVTGTDLAAVAVRRPTTSKAMGVSWGGQLPHELLDWLEITRRHLVPSGPNEFTDLLLIDLPDHDSTELTHRLTVDRLVQLVDALIWVVDPQKYADAALHDGYLKKLAPYAEVMLVVLNQADRLPPAELDRCLLDLRRLLDSEGLRATPIMSTSAVRGTGVPELRAALARTVANKQAMARRLSADVAVSAAALAADLGEKPAPFINDTARHTVIQRAGRRCRGAAGCRRGAGSLAAPGLDGHRLAVRHLVVAAASRPVEEAAPRPQAGRPQPHGGEPDLVAEGQLRAARPRGAGIAGTDRFGRGRAAARVGATGA